MSYRAKWFKHNKPTLTGKYRCSHCGKKYRKKDIDIDHIVPKSRGGTNDLSNLQALCRYCNRSKGNRMQDTKYDIKRLMKKHGGDEGYGKVYVPKSYDKFCFVCNKKVGLLRNVKLEHSGIMCKSCYKKLCHAYRRKRLYLVISVRRKLEQFNKKEVRELIKRYK